MAIRTGGVTDASSDASAASRVKRWTWGAAVISIIAVLALAASPLGPVFSLADYASLTMDRDERTTADVVGGQLRSVSLSESVFAGFSVHGEVGVLWVFSSSASDDVEGLAKLARETADAQGLLLTRIDLRDATLGRLIEQGGH